MGLLIELGEALIVLVLAACPICSALVAGSKGRNPLSWLFLGTIFGPFGLLAAVGVLPVASDAEQLARAGHRSPLKICPFCAEAIRQEATVCRYCTQVLEEEPA